MTIKILCEEARKEIRKNQENFDVVLDDGGFTLVPVSELNAPNVYAVSAGENLFSVAKIWKQLVKEGKKPVGITNDATGYIKVRTNSSVVKSYLTPVISADL